MFKYLLSLLGLCAAYAEQFEVIIKYHAPNLTLLVPIVDPKVQSVSFHAEMTTRTWDGKGVPTGSGWEYTGYLPDASIVNFFIYANVQYYNGLVVTTPPSILTVDSPVKAFSAMDVRKIRDVIFRDDCNSFNRDNWVPEVSMFGGMNGEFQVYTPESKNIYAANGKLYLRPTITTDDARWDENFLYTGIMDIGQIWGICTNDGNNGCIREGKNGMLPPVMSGKVSSTPTIRFGTVEVRARIPRGDWLWPAIWMMPKASVYGGWPRSGDIDIMESTGNAGDNGVGKVISLLNWGPAWDQNKYNLTRAERHATDFHADFHTYRLEWTEDYLRTYVDNDQILNVDVGAGFWAKGGFSGYNIWAGQGKSAPFDQDLYLILQVAVGGTNGYFPDNINWGIKKPWTNNSPHPVEDFWSARNDWLPSWQGDNTALQVDYVEFRS